VKAEEPAAVDDHVEVGAGDSPAWMAGGSSLVARRIHMTVETWDRTPLREQETVFGHTTGAGAPLSDGTEFTEPDFTVIGRLNAGLFFISFQRSPEQFTRAQLNLAKMDARNEYIRHVGSALFAIPPGADAGSYVGARLFS